MDKFTKKQPINTLKKGDIVMDIFVVKIKKGVSPYSKGYSFTLILSDSSGKSLEYKYWGGLDEAKVTALFDSIRSDSVVLVQGRFSFYNDKPQIVANEQDMIRVLNRDEYETDFIKQGKKDPDGMYADLMAIIQNIEEPVYKQLLVSVFSDKSIENKIKKHPAAIEIHHNWVAGLLQHMLEIVEYCKTSLKLFPDLNPDLLITGALLHDIGKLEELEVTSRIRGTQKGQLIGHLPLGIVFISRKLDEINGSEILKNKLLHMIVSHHGKVEFGSPKEPMFPEALALYYADELSSKLTEMTEYIKEHKDSTEDDFMYHYKKGIDVLLR